MCLIVFAYQAHPEFPLIVAANRDEYYARPTQPAHFWTNHPLVFAGRDIESPNINNQGTWMGINRRGRFAAVTNFREMDFNETTAKRSRGELTANFLCSDTSATEYLLTVQKTAENYKGFNLLLWEAHHLFYVSNRIEKIQPLKPGIYGLSNGALDSVWPKVVQAKQQLASLITKPFSADILLSILMNRDQAADHSLPDTGIDLESERLLSSCFIQSEHYGTRASSVLLVNKNNEMTFLEQNWREHAADIKNAAWERRFLKLSTDNP